MTEGTMLDENVWRCLAAIRLYGPIETVGVMALLTPKHKKGQTDFPPGFREECARCLEFLFTKGLISAGGKVLTYSCTVKGKRAYDVQARMINIKRRRAAAADRWQNRLTTWFDANEF